MNHNIFNQLKKIKDLIDNDDKHNIMKKVFFSFLKNSNSPFYSDNYKIKVSIGQGNESKMWWCGIFDKELYYHSFGVRNDGHIGASKGYYIVYLFNQEKNCLYLTINQAAKDIHKPCNKEVLNYIMSINEFIRKQLSSDKIYLRNITRLLSDSSYPVAKDYELGTIIAIQYDLDGESISDNIFYRDLDNIKFEFNKIKELFMLKGGIITIKNPKITYDLINRVVIDYSNKCDSEEIDEGYDFIHDAYMAKDISKDVAYMKGERVVKRVVYKGTERVQTDPSLRKFALNQVDFCCQYDKFHETFRMNNKDIYMEVHHLIPLKYQDQFGDNFNLDRIENLVVVCPTCHRAIHYGSQKVKRKILESLYNKSSIKEILRDSHNCKNFDQFFNLYYK